MDAITRLIEELGASDSSRPLEGGRPHLRRGRRPRRGHGAAADGAAKGLDEEQLEAALERAVVDHELDLNPIPRRTRKLNQLIKDATLALGLTDSDLENLFRGIVRRAGLPLPESNQWLWTGERHYKPGFLWAITA